MKLGIVGDFNENFRPHQVTNEAVKHSLEKLNISLEYEWISTDSIDEGFDKIIQTYNGFWIAPGSPYNNMSGVLNIIRHAREKQIPTLGTCGGFQHMVIEFARNVLGIEEAQHAEYDPYASKLVVNPLSCSMVGQTLEIGLICQESKTFRIFDTEKIKEKYYCNFGLNPEYQNQIHTGGFRIVGSDDLQEARILELEDHPFFIATLFVPQDNSTSENPHPLVTEFLRLVSSGKNPSSNQ